MCARVPESAKVQFAGTHRDIHDPGRKEGSEAWESLGGSLQDAHLPTIFYAGLCAKG